MPIHGRMRRPAAVVLSFAWLSAITLAVMLVLGPLFMAFLALLIGEGLDGILRQTAELYVEAWTFQWVPRRFDDDLLITAGVFAGWVALQTAFLSPLVGRPRPEGEGRSLLPSVIAATLLATTGCALAWVAIVEAVVSLTLPEDGTLSDVYGTVTILGWFGGLGIWAAGGFVWYRLLRSAGARYDPTGLDRFLRRILAGTAVEAALGTLAVLLVRRREDCMCVTGSFLSLSYSLMVLIWLCGPWAVLFATRSERSRWRQLACGGCGYVRRTGATRCPECGQAFATQT